MRKNKIISKIFGSNDEEYNLLNSWAMDKKNDTQNLKNLTNLWESVDQLDTYKDFDTNNALNQTIIRINKQNRNKKIYKLLILITLGLFTVLVGLYYFNQNEKTTVNSYYAQTIEYITRLDGTTITLHSDTKLIENIEMNTYSIQGEATFDVTKQNVPLVIKLDNGEVTVVGTKFTVNNRDGKSTLDLFEGKVELRNISNQSLSLNAGERGEIFPSEILVTPFNHKDAKINLVYANFSLNSVLTELNSIFGSHYKILPDMDNIMINATFKNQTLINIITELQLISGMSIVNATD